MIPGYEVIPEELAYNLYAAIQEVHARLQLLVQMHTPYVNTGAGTSTPAHGQY